MLTLKNIKKIYKTNSFTQTTLENINLSFRKNEFVTILGPSGSGKTTLLNIIGALDDYTDGDLLINNKSTRDFKTRNWDSYRNCKVGFIFQNYNLINHISVYKNVQLALTLSGTKKSKIRKKVMFVLKEVGLEKYANKKTNELSGGQMQRVAIARALVNDPDIILADEPTGALDSKTSIQIMELIKKISKDKLVIMVTHNEILAQKYSTRIINLKDGKIDGDSNPFVKETVKAPNLVLKKTKMNFFSALSLSLNNIRAKKGRTFLTILASSIGIVGIALILAISNGFNKKIEEFERDTMSSFPILIARNTLIDKEIYDEYSSYDDVLVMYDKDEDKSIHTNYITKDYLDYIDKIGYKYLNAISYHRLINLNLITNKDDSYKYINSSMVNFVEIPKTSKHNSFLKENFDLLSGTLPISSHDMVLILDSENKVDKKILEGLFIDTGKNTINFNEVIGKELKLVKNDDYYKKTLGSLYVINEPSKKLYENSEITLKITGIVREKKNNSLPFISADKSISKIGYSEELISEVVKQNEKSLVVEEQQNAKNLIFMGGLNFDDVGITKKDALLMLGKDDDPVSVSIYPKSFEAKDKIIKYLDLYNEDKEEKENIIYTDYAGEMSSLTSSIINGITIVLIFFSSISLVVSSIMIGIITYISVLERTKEIGILRSLGARRKDISRIFSSENLMVGLMSGLMGILVTLILLFFINFIIYRLTGLKNVGVLKPFYVILLIVTNVILAFISGFIPSKRASRKKPVEALRRK